MHNSQLKPLYILNKSRLQIGSGSLFIRNVANISSQNDETPKYLCIFVPLIYKIVTRCR